MVTRPMKRASCRWTWLVCQLACVGVLVCGGFLNTARAQTHGSLPPFVERMVPISVVPKGWTAVTDSFIASPDSSRVAMLVSRNDEGIDKALMVDNVRSRTSSLMYGPTFSPDSSRIATVSREGDRGLLLYKNRRFEVWGPDPVAPPIYSPNGKRVAYVGRKGKRRLVLVDDRPNVVHYDEILVDSLSFSPDSRHFVYVGRRNAAWFVVFNGQESTPYAAVEKPVFSANSQRLAYWAQDAAGTWVAVVDGQPNGLMLVESQAGLRFTHDSQRLVAFGSRVGRWHVIVDGQYGQGYDALGVGSLTISPDSKHIAYAAREDARWKIVVDGFTVGDYEALLAGSLRFSPDSSSLAYVAKDRAGWFAVANNDRHRSFDQIASQSLQFSPDSQRFAYVARNDGERASVIVDGYRWAVCDAVEDLTFSPDSASVAWVERHGETSRVVVDGVEGAHGFDGLVSGASLVFDRSNHLHTVVYKRPGPVFFRYEAQLYPDNAGESDDPTGR